MNTAMPTTGVLLGGVLLLGAGGVRAQDWPQWRGPHRDAKVTGFTAPGTWPKELTRKWKVTVGEGAATPALVGDKLFVFARQEGKEVLRCLDVTTGKELWRDQYASEGATGPSSGFSGPRSSPAVADGKVLTLGVRGILSCYETDSGKLRWRKDDFSKSLPRFYTSCSPLLVDGLCIVQLGGDSKGAMVAYDLATGNEKWSWTGDGTGYASPVLLAADGTQAIVAETAGNIVGVGLADGKPAWQIAFKARYNACTPVVDGQTVIFSGSGRGTRAVKIVKDGASVGAKELWKNPDVGVQFNTPVVKNGLIFGLSDRDDWFCLHADTGKTAWSVPKGTSAGSGGAGGGGRGGRGGRGMGRGGFGSIVDAGPVLFGLTPGGDLVVFEPSDREFKPLARYKVADRDAYAYPVLAGNRVFVKDRDSVTLWTIE
jgi:outer membrane protein assembly factor BamB